MAHRLRIGPACGLMLAIAALPAMAQQAPSPGLHVELGLDVSRFLRGGPWGPGLRMAIGRDDRVVLELQADWLDAFRTQRYVDQPIWFYSWKVKHTLVSLDDARTYRAFVTYGTTGWIERGNTRDGPTTHLIAPFFPLLGGGVQKAIGQRVAIRADAQLLIWYGEGAAAIPRLGSGVSVAFGRR